MVSNLTAFYNSFVQTLNPAEGVEKKHQDQKLTRLFPSSQLENQESEALINRVVDFEGSKKHEKAIVSDEVSITWYNKALVVFGCYEQILSRDPSNVQLFWKIGTLLDNSRHYKEALQCYNKGLKIDSQNFRILNNHGVALGHLGRHEEGLTSFKQALALDPCNVKILKNIGLALENLGHYQEALDAYEKGLASEPNHVPTLLYRGWLLTKLKRYDEAIDSYNQALAISPNMMILIYKTEGYLKKIWQFTHA